MGGFVRTVAQKITEDEQQSLAQSRFARGNSDEPIAQFADHPTEVNPLRAAWEAFNPGKTFGVDQGGDYQPPQQFLGGAVSNLPGYAPQDQQYLAQQQATADFNRYANWAESQIPDNSWSVPDAVLQSPQMQTYQNVLGPQYRAQQAYLNALPAPTRPEDMNPWDVLAAADPLGTINRGLALPGTLASNATRSIPTGGETLGERIDNAPAAIRYPANFALDAAPYVAADVAAGGALTPAFTGQAMLQAAQIDAAYNAGQIDGPTALKQLALTVGPLATPLLLHAAGSGLKALGEYAKSPEGQGIIAKLQGERGGGSFGEKPPQAGAGGEPSPAGNLLPSPPEPAADMVPPENRQLLEVLNETMPSRQLREAQLQQGRGRQFGNRRVAIEQAVAQGKSPEEVLGLGKQAMSGQILDRPDALRSRFTEPNVQSYYKQILDAETTAKVTEKESLAAKDGLDRLMNGVRSDGTRNPIMPHEAQAIARVFGPEFADALPTTPERMSMFDKAMAPLQLLRSVKTAFDDSFGLGQGWKEIPVNFSGWWKGTKNLKAMLSDENLDAAMEQLRNESPNYVRGQNMERPLGIMTTSGGPRAAEEYLSPVTKKVAGLALSERRFVARGNIIRQTGLDKMVDIWKKANDNAEPPDDIFQHMIDIENSSTNWGHLSPKLGNTGSILSQMLFSARAKAALVQYPINIAKAMASGDPALRKIAATRLAAWLGMNAVAMASANVAGQMMGIGHADVNPLSKNFGQIVFGPQKIDIWQGYSPIARMLIQSAKGEVQKPGHIAPTSISRFTPWTNYSRNQLSPLAAFIYDASVAKGHNVAGQPMTDKAYWYNTLVPLFVSDTVDSLKQMGLAGVPGAVASFEGLRVNTYDSNESPADIQKANAKTELDRQGYGDIPDKAWADTAKRFNLSGSDSFKQFLDDDFARYQKAHPGDPAVQKAKYEALPGVKRARAYYNQQVNRYQAPFERNQETRKLLLQAGILKPTKPADQKLLEDTAQ